MEKVWKNDRKMEKERESIRDREKNVFICL